MHTVIQRAKLLKALYMFQPDYCVVITMVFTRKRIDFKWAIIFAHMNLSSNGAVQFSLRPGDAGLQAMTGTSIDLSEATSWVFTRGHFP